MDDTVSEPYSKKVKKTGTLKTSDGEDEDREDWDQEDQYHQDDGDHEHLHQPFLCLKRALRHSIVYRLVGTTGLRLAGRPMGYR
eukprot:840134-Rhodomonas_salina.1